MQSMNRKFVLVFVVAATLFLTGSSAFAVNWKIPDNVRIVQPDNTDSTRVFTTIGAALSSISGASSTNRFIIKVMPGVYNETVTTSSYVDIVGSGESNTVISSSTACSAPNPPDAATLTIASDSSVKNLKVVNSGTGTCIAAVRFADNAVASAESITALATSGGHSVGIAITGSSSNVKLTNVKVNADSTDSEGYGLGIMIWGGSAEISHATVIGNGGHTGYGVYSDGATVLRDSVLTATNPSHSAAGIFSPSGSLSASNLTVTAVTTGDGYAYAVDAGSNAKVGSSLLAGGINGTPKIVNCWDQDFNAITNQ